jgi:hypothetical protein
MIEASTQFMVGRLSTESGKCNSFNLDGIFGNDTAPFNVWGLPPFTVRGIIRALYKSVRPSRVDLGAHAACRRSFEPWDI